MIETSIQNGKTVVSREYLRNWDFNGKILTNKQLQSAIEMRKQYVSIGSLLVVPEIDDDGVEYFLVIGGNTRNLADERLGKETEEVEIIDFLKKEDGRWYVFKDGELFDKPPFKSFGTRNAAMKSYSLLHNSHLSGYSPDEIANQMDDPEFEDVDWGQAFVQIGDPQAIAEFAEKIAPEALAELEKLANDPTVKLDGIATIEKDEPEDDTPKTEKARQNPDEKGETYLTECPDCACVFNPRQHPAKEGAKETMVN